MTYAAGAILIARTPGPKIARFEPKRLAEKHPGIGAALIGFALDHPYGIYAFLRRFMPILTVGNWAFISRYDHVTEVLGRQDAFAVPFGPKIEILNDGPNFLLGMADSPEYQALHKIVAVVFPVTDNATLVGPIAAEEAEALISGSNGRIDAVRDLITRVPTRVCERYYGVEVPDEVRFGHITIAMSTFMFGDPTDNPRVRDEAVKAGKELRPMIDAAITRARGERTLAADTIVRRLLEPTLNDGAGVPDATIRAILIGMITGFVPTNTMGAGHMLEMLLRRPDMMKAARAAALADDDELLKRVLWEAFRFLPLNPGPFRECPADAVIAGKVIRKGMKMLVGTHPAMFDPRRIDNPNRFDPDRPSRDNLTFGYGLHWCIGAPLAEAQIVATLKPLLSRRNLRRAPGKAGQLQKDGPFPAHLVVEFDPD
jgi:cytochrome P450